MNGAGFIKDMISVNRNNRSLLKGQDSAKYKNFDTSYITDWVISRKPLKFKKASPEYLLKLKQQLKRDRKINQFKTVIVGLIVLPVLAVLGVTLYNLLF